MGQEEPVKLRESGVNEVQRSTGYQHQRLHYKWDMNVTETNEDQKGFLPAEPGAL